MQAVRGGSLDGSGGQTGKLVAAAGGGAPKGGKGPRKGERGRERERGAVKGGERP